MRAYKKHARRRETGLSYVETLLAAVILAIGVVPALDSLQSAFTSVTTNEEMLQQQQRLASRLEEVIGEPFTVLDDEAELLADETALSSYSDPPGPERLVVNLSRYDGDADPFIVTQDGLIWIRVAIEGTTHELTTLVAR